MTTPGDGSQPDKPTLEYATPPQRLARRDEFTWACAVSGILISAFGLAVCFLMLLHPSSNSNLIVPAIMLVPLVILLVAEVISIARRSLLATRVVLILLKLLLVGLLLSLLSDRFRLVRPLHILTPLYVFGSMIGHTRWMMLIKKSQAEPLPAEPISMDIRA